MILGLRTVVYPAPDLAKAKAWYGIVFQKEPYFDQPFYVGYQVGGFELGLVPDGTPSEGGGKALWGVTDISAEVSRLAAAGIAATSIHDVGGEIKVCDLLDPFGNVVGLIENPHFDSKQAR